MPQNRSIDYSVLELAVVGQDIPHHKVFENSVELARLAEDLGYKRFWLAEHHNMVSIASTATTVLMSHIASKTDHIRIGSGGIMLPNHSPLIVAEQFGTLGSLYPDRIDMGLGRAPGTDQVTAHAIRSDRMNSVFKFPHEIDEIQKYFRNDKATTKVRATVAEGVKIPMYILGSSTDSAHVAAQKGLPYVFASHFAPAQLFQAMEIYYREFQPSEYLDEPYSIAGINVVASDSMEEAEKISTSSLRMMVGVLTGNLDYLQKPEEMTAELREVRENPALQRMLQYAFVGDKAHVKDKTEDFLKQTGVDEVIVASHIYHQEDRLKSFRIFSEIMEEINQPTEANIKLP
ncbi:LLM class flavin-dependent oxidoreductase [Christiangramia sp. SM2212]|uniref:LLM class flavin-dependent oxidoreductase n=1 Tax=Christiangramia sediminicola TaxID=3073267 RepID=A0ABU1EL59_9FLAO|nr:LLM class flavin-dependent oxidoreductase [Christiangramia sp. SM2212]MDR5589064.1 LLM class flavin-dependent oxidoreductase [Christiangramia sp. SM2212]